MRRSWIYFPISYLILTALSGAFMRSMAVYPIQVFNYSYLLHAHSHLAILGWGYVALFLFIIYYFFTIEERQAKPIKVLFWLTQVTVIGMFLSFSYQGYGIISIIFSTLHILLSYCFSVIVLTYFKQKRKQLFKGPISVPTLYVIGAVVCLLISSIGPWLLAYLSANKLTQSPLFDMAIYFYLHFQYNGWFTLGLIAILFALFEKYKVIYSKKLAKVQFSIFILSVLPAYLLAILWFELHITWHMIAIIAGVLHWLSMMIFFYILYKARTSILALFTGWSKVFLALALFALFLKITMELGSAIPALTEIIYDTRSVIIGYLHLTLLGFVSFLCLALFLKSEWLNAKKGISKIGFLLFITGFIVNEVYLFSQSLYEWLGNNKLPLYESVLLVSSVLMLVGIIMFFYGSIFSKPRNSKGA